ncbi:MAG: HlyD family efflux transporter periplasmic adaptor subunit [Vicinamibacterales bacterium]
MDVARPIDRRRVRRQRAGVALAVLVVVALTGAGLSRLREAAPVVDAGTVWIDTVRRGPMVREVRGIGTLVPEDIRWIPATSDGRVERIVLRPGSRVEPESIVLELSNPQVDQAWEEARLKLEAAEASLANLRVQLQNDLLQQRATAASVSADARKARMQAEMNEALAKNRLVSELVRRQSTLDAEQLAEREDIARQQLAMREESTRTQLLVQQSTVDQARAVVALRRREHDELQVKAGLSGVLQIVPVDAGQRVAAGTNLARVANPLRLKAEVRIAENQAKDILIGQRASIDTRNGLVPGRVTRIDPSVQNGTRTVDVSLDGDLPAGAVPDLSVDGTIELERLGEVLYVGRPAFGQEQSTVTLFRLEQDGTNANRVQVRLGRSSVSTIEVLGGLAPGDRVVLSDMSAWDTTDRVRLAR